MPLPHYFNPLGVSIPGGKRQKLLALLRSICIVGGVAASQAVGQQSQASPDPV